MNTGGNCNFLCVFCVLISIITINSASSTRRVVQQFSHDESKKDEKEGSLKDEILESLESKISESDIENIFRAPISSTQLNRPSPPSSDLPLQHSFIPTLSPKNDPALYLILYSSLKPSHYEPTNSTPQPSLLDSTEALKFRSEQPTFIPTQNPTLIPTQNPTLIPTQNPSKFLSLLPTLSPSILPTHPPSSIPTLIFTFHPSSLSSAVPSTNPTNLPTFDKSMKPSQFLSEEPTFSPTPRPSKFFSLIPTTQPSTLPTYYPSLKSSVSPSMKPTIRPIFQASVKPSEAQFENPTSSPTSNLSESPHVVPTHPFNSLSFSPSIKTTRMVEFYPSSDASTTPSTDSSDQHSFRLTMKPASQILFVGQKNLKNAELERGPQEMHSGIKIMYIFIPIVSAIAFIVVITFICVFFTGKEVGSMDAVPSWRLPENSFMEKSTSSGDISSFTENYVHRVNNGATQKISRFPFMKESSIGQFRSNLDERSTMACEDTFEEPYICQLPIDMSSDESFEYLNYIDDINTENTPINNEIFDSYGHCLDPGNGYSTGSSVFSGNGINGSTYPTQTSVEFCNLPNDLSQEYNENCSPHQLIDESILGQQPNYITDVVDGNGKRLFYKITPEFSKHYNYPRQSISQEYINEVAAENEASYGVPDNRNRVDFYYNYPPE